MYIFVYDVTNVIHKLLLPQMNYNLSKFQAAPLEAQFTTYTSQADGTEATMKDMARWCKDAGLFKGKVKCMSLNKLSLAFSAAALEGKK